LSLAQRFRPRENQETDAAASGMIPVLNLADGGEAPAEQSPVELVSTWARAAQDLVDRQRAALHEE
jgi:hypothetical protein